MEKQLSFQQPVVTRWGCKLPQRGLGRSPNRKRIRCTLELSESHWWGGNHFEYCEVHVLQQGDQNLAQTQGCIITWSEKL